MKIGLVRRGYSRTGGAEAYLRRFAEAAVAAGHDACCFPSNGRSAEWPFDAHPRSVERFPAALCRCARSSCRRGDRLRFSLQPRTRLGVRRSIARATACMPPGWSGGRVSSRRGSRGSAALQRQASRDPRARKASLQPGGARQVIANSRMVKREIERHFGYPSEQHPRRPQRRAGSHRGAGRARGEARARTRARRRRLRRCFSRAPAGSGKGLRFAIEAVNAARADRVTLLVAGRGNHSAAAAFEARALPRSGGEMPPLLAAADAFILPTIYEPFSNACLEALAAGLAGHHDRVQWFCGDHRARRGR